MLTAAALPAAQWSSPSRLDPSFASGASRHLFMRRILCAMFMWEIVCAASMEQAPRKDRGAGACVAGAPCGAGQLPEGRQPGAAAAAAVHAGAAAHRGPWTQLCPSPGRGIVALPPHCWQIDRQTGSAHGGIRTLPLACCAPWADSQTDRQADGQNQGVGQGPVRIERICLSVIPSPFGLAICSLAARNLQHVATTAAAQLIPSQAVPSASVRLHRRSGGCSRGGQRMTPLRSICLSG
jgi:hypothetical protein